MITKPRRGRPETYPLGRLEYRVTWRGLYWSRCAKFRLYQRLEAAERFAELLRETGGYSFVMIEARRVAPWERVKGSYE